MSTHTPTAPGAGKTRHQDIALLLLAMVQFLIVIDASIVNVALPSIGRGLHFSQEDLSWVVNAYTLTFGGFLLLGGRMADLLGRRRMFMVGLFVFFVASLMGGLAQSTGWLIAARAVQGLGAAIVSPAALSIITTTFAEGSERNRALGVWGAVAGAGGAAGVLLGGVLTQYLDWRWVLFVNVPLGIFAVLAAPRILVESKAEDAGTFDVVGATLVTAALALLVYAFVEAVTKGWTSGATLGEIGGSIVLMALFVVVERVQASPLVPFSIFRLRTLRGANIIGLLIGMSLFSMFYFISLYMQDVLGDSAITTGLSYLPLAIVIILGAGAGSALTQRIGAKATLTAGTVCVAVALAWFSRISPDGSFASDVLGPSILAGLGLGLSFVSVTIASVAGIKPHQAGLASGLINASQQVGGALGLGILASIANSAARSSHAPAREALTHGFARAFTVDSGIAILAVVLTLLLIFHRDSVQAADAVQEVEAAII